MQKHWTLRLHLPIEIRIPQEATIFQGLVLGFLRFKEIGMVELLKATLTALQDKIIDQMKRSNPGPYRHKGK